MPKELTVEMIVKRARGNTDLSSIKQLNFWGQSLGDISVLSHCTSLQSATFSQNYISSLKCFEGMIYLRELSLARNSINNLKEIRYLSTCPSLQKLWLKDNPICKLWDYRIQVINILPNLKFLDDEPITVEERQIANSGFFNSNYEPASSKYETKRQNEFFNSNYESAPSKYETKRQNEFFNSNYEPAPSKYEPKRQNVKAPSYDPFADSGVKYVNNFQQYGRAYDRPQRDYMSEEMRRSNYPPAMPQMAEENIKYVNNESNFGVYQNKRSDTSGNRYGRYDSEKKKAAPPKNNFHYEQRNINQPNNNNINVGRNRSYNHYRRNIPGSAKSNQRKYVIASSSGKKPNIKPKLNASLNAKRNMNINMNANMNANNNQKEVSSNSNQQTQQGVVDCIGVLMKGLTRDELLYIANHIENKISKI